MAFGATVCAPLSGSLVGRFGPRRPLLLAGTFITAGGVSLVNLGQHTNVTLLLLAYLLIGIGFGFANAPITNTAVTGLPPARAGVAGAITSISTASRISHRHRHRRRARRRRPSGQSRPGIPPRMADRHRLRHLPLRRGRSRPPSGMTRQNAPLSIKGAAGSNAARPLRPRTPPPNGIAPLRTRSDRSLP